VKELEENGIGRPSTYASIIATIEAREYMEKREAKLYPTELGFLVTDLLVEHFQDIMNVEYTAAMEQRARRDRGGHGQPPQHAQPVLEEVREGPEEGQKRDEDVKAMEEKTDEVCDKCGSPMVIKWGRYGKFLACSAIPSARTRGRWRAARRTAARAARGRGQGVCPNDGQPMVLKKGRFGPFLACTNYPECKVTKRLVRGEGGKLQVERWPPSTRSARVRKDLMWRRGRFGAFIACSNYPNCKYIKKKEAKEIGFPARSAAQGQVVERKGAGAGRSTAARAIPSASSPRTTARSPSPARLRPRYLLEKETKKEGKVVFCGNEACHYKRAAA
jgi:DNA topoisomerase-1